MATQMESVTDTAEAAGEPAVREDIRITLDVTPPMKAVLDRLAQQSRTTPAEVLRRAIALLNAVKQAEEKGEGTAVLEKNGRIVAKLVGF